MFRAQPFFLKLTNRSIEAPIRLSKARNFCLPMSNTLPEPLRNPKWKFYAWRVENNDDADDDDDDVDDDNDVDDNNDDDDEDYDVDDDDYYEGAGGDSYEKCYTVHARRPCRMTTGCGDIYDCSYSAQNLSE
ncbi:hypothetical protein ElyMa_000740700 [Elysia marginata]|uniref:Uncharacterized protein n=1 Tax=Elysia marginata TaxID=1093978 RepID=A0AAV4GQI4_9GAST|nr:hypothetical protein ElyMa_000740700 [Elysia marginata]